MMQFSVPSLPYDYTALEPYIDAETMMLHHDKHHQAYVDKLNTALALAPDLTYATVEELLRHINEIPEEIKTAVKNHGGGHSNHSIYWKILSPTPTTPSDSMMQLLTKAFGSLEGFTEKMTAVATGQFGSGWAWLIKNAAGDLEIKGYANQDSPYMDGLTPLLGIDVWEHAYYLTYQNRRPEYVKAFFSLINWPEVEARLNS